MRSFGWGNYWDKISDRPGITCVLWVGGALAWRKRPEICHWIIEDLLYICMGKICQMNPDFNIIIMLSNYIKMTGMVRLTQLCGLEQIEIDARGSIWGN